ncbi:Hypothetical predicted protein [Paramuricea clavata]|uniref:Uncharacterized protein n=1 Tax=Paramuricea clavata TaxID=317549 RepID=A0A6S7LQX3_PARCT|nr:Hypothetical predicted protein [Paramuricea clavata]
MALLEKERFKQHNMKKYAQAASIEEQISASRKETHPLTEKLAKLQEKEARSNRYHTAKASQSNNPKGKGQTAEVNKQAQRTCFKVELNLKCREQWILAQIDSGEGVMNNEKDVGKDMNEESKEMTQIALFYEFDDFARYTTWAKRYF